MYTRQYKIANRHLLTYMCQFVCSTITIHVYAWQSVYTFIGEHIYA